MVWAAVLTTCQGGGPADEALVDQTIDRLGELGLSAEAQNTLRGIRNLTARTQSVAARLALMWALAKESGVHAFDQPLPLTWKEKKPLSGLGYDALGAPCLSDGTVSISFAHCEGMAVAACAASGVKIGVDAERIDRPLARRDDIAKRLFSPAELALWESNGRRMIDFLRIWTRKEALGKAEGTGLRADASALDTQAVSSDCFSEHMVGDIMITLCVIE
ncbi:MAG: 4'-phosphopantetheinyl transferase superfamily protein [Ruminococcaceae bacterium]|nr:4'-phosphopantetheinyl transferase superfamily protein [Oscillospiraceae bacterium]